MPTFKFQIGDIVALSSHPYFEGIDTIIQSGDPLQQSPLMIIAESIEVKRSDNSTNLLSPLQHKCFWYSQKSNSFEHTWISESILKLIEKSKDILDFIPEVGTKLLFRTTHMELHKRKSSLVVDSSLKNSHSTQVTSLLSFVPPMLMVSGYINKDSKSGIVTELEPSSIKDYNFLKVTWFNFSQDKISEGIIPVSCLKVLPESATDLIQQLQEVINKQQYIAVNIGSVQTIIKPLSIHFLCGYYFLKAHDFLTDSELNNIAVSDIKIKQIYKSHILNKAPAYDFKKGKKPTLYAEDVIQKAIKKGKYIRIKYISRNNVTSVRCIREFSIHKFKDKKEKISLLTGHCLTKLDTRHFNVDRISWVEMIDFPL